MPNRPSLTSHTAQWAETQMLVERKEAASATNLFTVISPATICAFPATLLDDRSKQTGLLATSPELTQLVQSLRGDYELCDSENQIAVSRLATLSKNERARKVTVGAVEARQQDDSAESDERRDQPAMAAHHALSTDHVAEVGSSNDADGFGFDLDEQEVESGFGQESGVVVVEAKREPNWHR
ncbi:hypothetical protein BLNAU_15552 [Blattamonas nauphoetae]|uniref:Uncharacterized protein n=1 Tax=Blattamonas nauphoetae TaxID=2049346 RepID=A0ABQ9XF35_9EUKA|nr:hypothetical protein BLNAU_15552 [Blattamonas nauphoetae]